MTGSEAAGAAVRADPRRLCVFCGSSPGAHPAYRVAAERLGATLVERGWELVYGGGNVGLMGVLADAVLARGGRVTGIIPDGLLRREVGHAGVTELRVVGSMHERKASMAELASGFVALPGGIGTLEEIFEVLTWAQLGIHDKPCALLDVAGYYRPLVGFLDRVVEQRFARAEHRAMLMLEDDPGRLLDRFESYRAPTVAKWLDRDET
ncbi:MAG TPA: TIGR00730 family Rossman fold protein [Thermoanaerobaculia bacterium]|nr:TIGR00730 family Rossman fold protein [Thermoanaerobaculia bacterium]